MSYLCSDLIYSALRKINVLAAGETPSTDEATDALASLNVLLESWSAEQISVYTTAIFSNALTGGTQTYTMGTGGVFNTARPLKIDSAAIIGSDTLHHPMTIVGVADWNKIEEKTLTGILPKVLYNDNAFPLTNISVWPQPSGTPTLRLYVWLALQQFVALTDAYALPPAYFRALVYNLAIDLAPEYGQKALAAAAGIADVAAAAKNDVAMLNASNEIGKEPSALPQPAAEGKAA